MNERVKKWLMKAANAVCWAIILGAGAWVLYWVMQICVCTSFHTPTQSMTPTILPGDNGIVNKLKLGARLFDLFAADRGEPYTIRRLPGYGKLGRGDIIVFNYPYRERRDSIALNTRLYYCKRAVGVPGDTLRIHGCFYRVNSLPDTLGIASEQRLLAEYLGQLPTDSVPDWVPTIPYDSAFGWTIAEFGPMVIPAAGMTMPLTRANYSLYRRYIEWETGKKLLWHDPGARCPRGYATLDGERTDAYTFTKDYCFAAGDHVLDSRDSRYFGLVPLDFIVGTASFIWKSLDSSRIFKSIE